MRATGFPKSLAKSPALRLQRSTTVLAFMLVGLTVLGLALLHMLNAASEAGGLRVLILVVSVAFLFVALAPLATALIAGQGDWFDVRNLFLLVYTLLSVAYPLARALSGESASQDVLSSVQPWPLGTVLKALLLCFLGLIGFRIASAVPWGKGLAQRLPAFPSGWNLHKAYTLAYAYLILGIILYSIFIVQAGGLRTYLEISGGGSGESYLLDQGEGLLKVGWIIIQLALILLAFTVLQEKHPSPIHKLFVFGLCSAFVIMALAIGRRSHIVILGLSILAGYHFFVRSISRRSMAVMALGGLLFVNSLSFFRGQIGSGPGALYRRIHDGFSLEWLDLSNNYFGSPYVYALTDLLEAVPARFDYRYGATYAESVEILVPVALDPQRPPTGEEWYASTFHPREYAQGGGFGFFIVAEAYLNFGYPGPFVVLFLFGLFFTVLWNYLQAHLKNVSVVALYCALLPVSLTILNEGFAYFVKYFFVFTFLPVMVMAVLAGTRISANRARSFVRARVREGRREAEMRMQS